MQGLVLGLKVIEMKCDSYQKSGKYADVGWYMTSPELCFILLKL